MRVKKLLHLVAAMGMFVCAPMVLAQEPAADVQEVFRRFTEERDEIRSMQAQFTQLTMTPDEDIESTGTITYVNPKRIIFRYSDPPITYMINQGNAYEYDEELEQVLVYDIEGRPEAEAFFLGLDSDSKRVQDAYDMTLLAADDPERDAFALQLVPKESEDSDPIFERATLQLRQGDFMPTHIHIVNSEDSHVRFTLTDFVLNEALPREQSHVFVPEGSDCVVNDVAEDPVETGGRYYPLDVVVEDSVEGQDDDSEDAASGDE